MNGIDRIRRYVDARLAVSMVAEVEQSMRVANWFYDMILCDWMQRHPNNQRDYGDES